MACLSQIVYQPFSDKAPATVKSSLQQNLKDFLGEATSREFDQTDCEIIGHLAGEANDEANNKAARKHEIHEITVREMYDDKGTEALLVSTEHFLVLVFRGTETRSFADLRAHFLATKTRCETGGCLHSGFNEAFECVEEKIQKDLDKPEYANQPLIITGHSLGGALATIAAKRLSHKGGIAACYTFGSPRVADEEWAKGIKTPIYRIVNAVDAVTMLPPNGDVMDVFCGMPGSIGKFLRGIMNRFPNYRHIGEMRYLTDCDPGRYGNVQLLATASLIKIISMYKRRLTYKFFKRFLKDHSIIIYRRKLGIIANRNNQLLFS